MGGGRGLYKGGRGLYREQRRNMGEGGCIENREEMRGGEGKGCILGGVLGIPNTCLPKIVNVGKNGKNVYTVRGGGYV